MNDMPLLSIAIPSYNRQRELSLLLAEIAAQIGPYRDQIELLVSDNASSDTTPEVVRSFIGLGLAIRYIRNSENIGSSANVVQCFELSKGQYVLIMGDDDVLISGALARIMPVLSAGDIGLLYLSAYPFLEDYEEERPANYRTDDIVHYFNQVKFLARVSINLSFLSSLIVNKSVLVGKVDAERFSDSYLPQLSWVFELLFNYQHHAVLNQFVVAGKADNSGGYGICEVFGTNLGKIIDCFVQDGVPAEMFEPLLANMVRSFFPRHLLELRTRDHEFANESFDQLLRPRFGSRLDYWLYLYPVLRLPTCLATFWFAGITALNKVNNAIRIFKEKPFKRSGNT